MILIVADSMMRIGIEVQDAVYSVGCMGVADGGSRVPSIAWHPGEHWCPHGYVYLIPSDHVPSGDKASFGLVFGGRFPRHPFLMQEDD